MMRGGITCGLFLLAGYVFGNFAPFIERAGASYPGTIRASDDAYVFSIYKDEALADTEVSDGDSFRLGDYMIRLRGIDAPEIDQKCSKAGLSEPLACGLESQMFLASLLSRGKIRCDVLRTYGNRADIHRNRYVANCLLTA